MTRSIRAYAAPTPGAPLELSASILAKSHRRKSKLRLPIAGYATRTFPCSITSGACPSIPSFPVTKPWARSSTSANKPRGLKSASGSAWDGQPTVVSPVTSVCRATIIFACTLRAPSSDATEVLPTAYVFNGPGLVPCLTRSISRKPVPICAVASPFFRLCFSTTCLPQPGSESSASEASVTWLCNLLTNGVAKSTPLLPAITKKRRHGSLARIMSITRNAMEHSRKLREVSTSSSPLLMFRWILPDYLARSRQTAFFTLSGACLSQWRFLPSA